MSGKQHRRSLQRDGPLQPLLSTSPPSNEPQLMAGRRRPTTSPGPEARARHGLAPVGRGANRQLLSLSGQAAAAASSARQRDKWVPLPEDEDEDAAAAALAALPLEGTSPESLPSLAGADDFSALTITPGLFSDLDAPRGGRGSRGRITLYCPADSFNRKKLDEVLRASFPASAIKSYPDVFYVEFFAGGRWRRARGDLFFFDYGVVACWGLDSGQEAAVVASLAAAAAHQPVPPEDVEVDEFEFNYSSLEKPHIQNDTVTLHRKAAKDHQVKLAISYALAQSTKLSLHERRVSAMVLDTKHLPESLAATGKVALASATIAKLMGKVFIQKAAVNLLSSVLDTPEFFWRAPDSFQALYERICEYLELDQRVEVLNARFTVLQEMLDMLRDHENNHHAARLEWIVIWLIVIEVVVGLLERCAGLATPLSPRTARPRRCAGAAGGRRAASCGALSGKQHRRSLQRDGPLQPLLSTSPPNHEPQQLMAGRRRPTTSPGPEARARHGLAPVGRGANRQLLSLSGQAAAAASSARQRDKWVPLPEDEDEDEDAAAAALAALPLEGTSPESLPSLAGADDFSALTITPGAARHHPPPPAAPLRRAARPVTPSSAAAAACARPGLFSDLDAPRCGRGSRGRITLYCPADSFNRKKLDEVLRASFPASAIKSYPDVFYVEFFAAAGDAPGGDLFFFDYGVVACWGLDSGQEAAVVASLAAAAAHQPVPPEDVEVDEFEFNYSSLEKPHIQNDTVTLHRKAAKDHQVKLAISYALAQSTKLSLHERRVSAMVLDTKHLPESLAATGKVALASATIAKLMGKVFIQKAAVNLLSSVLDTPEFFWRAPDSFQVLYDNICEYLELDQRVEVLNARFTVLQEMLDMLRDHENNHHAARLEWIVIWLIVIEVVSGLLEGRGGTRRSERGFRALAQTDPRRLTASAPRTVEIGGLRRRWRRAPPAPAARRRHTAAEQKEDERAHGPRTLSFLLRGSCRARSPSCAAAGDAGAIM
ncbi:RMD1 [Scenedesmus sp. PABB004]|nr:RMD1 [Scenedesmus sp. PABB004]